MLNFESGRVDAMWLSYANRFANDAKGSATVEYAIIAGVMCLCIVAALVGVTNPVTTIFEAIAGLFPTI